MYNENIVPQVTLSVTTSYRPKRVVFLVHPERVNDNELNHIMRYNFSVWGGRFNVIIPATGSEIKPEWWKLLVISDPDVIYSLLPLDDGLIQRINKHVLPAKIIEVTPEDKKRLGSSFLINPFEIKALGIEDIPRFVWTSRGFIREPFFFYIKDSWKDGPYQTFVIRNFGVLPDIISMNDTFRDLPVEIIELDKISPTEIFKKILSYGARANFPIDICEKYVPRNYSLKHMPFNNGFHLIIGDSYLDVIYAWNRASITELNTGRNAFWLSQELCRDEELLNLLCEWIKQTFWAHDHNRTGKVISYSVDESELRRVADKMRDTLHFFFEPIQLPPDRFPCPDAFFPKRGAIMQGPERHTYQVPLSENKGLVGFPRPPFLKEEHSQRGWMVDLEIQYHPERYYEYTNLRPIWQLPKRVGISGKFFDSPRESRITFDGLPSTWVATTERTIGIHIPSDLAVVRTWFEHYHTNMNRKKYSQPKPRFTDLRVSEKGRYLQGVLQLFGNVYIAGRTFEDPFWRDVLVKMAEESITMTMKNLRDRFGELRGKALQSQTNNIWWKVNKKFDELKVLELEYLLRRKVLLQGIELRCPQCGTLQWYIVDDISSEMRCDGCLFHFPLPSSPEWSFRLNNLVRNALCKHGILAVLHALYKLHDESGTGMFLFLPSQDIFEGNQQNPFTDLDIVVIRNGKFLIGEVKSNPAGFKPDDFYKIKVTAEDLLPDEVLLAAEGETWPPDVEKEIKQLTETLKSLDIKVKPLLLQWI